MNQEKTFRINLPTLFERVNERRREQGLPSVEPAMMAVRASIKFAIRQQKHLDLKGDEVDLDAAEADALCQTLNDLFNVDMQVAEEAGSPSEAAPATPAASMRPPPSGEADEGAVYSLPLFNFYASINRERRAKGLSPAEPAVISVRTGIKFTIMRRRTLNFREDKLILSEADLRVIDSIIAQQFDVAIPGGLLSLCKSPTATTPPKEAVAMVAQSGPKSFLTRVLSLFTGKQTRPQAHQTQHYSLDTNNLLLSIITRRAYLGHKPITPDKVKDRCGKALSAELELEVDLTDAKIALTPEQLDAFANAIRKEFDIMFEDLDDLLGKKPRT